MLPHTASQPYPPLPDEVDDSVVYATHTDPQPQGTVPVMSCFLANVRLFVSCDPGTSMEMDGGLGAHIGWEQRRQTLC